MTEQTHYELVASVGGFDEGDVLDVTARFGDWHLYDVRLEPVERHRTGSVELTADELEAVAEPSETAG